jgi:hypothetical protein
MEWSGVRTGGRHQRRDDRRTGRTDRQLQLTALRLQTMHDVAVEIIRRVGQHAAGEAQLA